MIDKNSSFPIVFSENKLIYKNLIRNKEGEDHILNHENHFSICFDYSLGSVFLQ